MNAAPDGSLLMCGKEVRHAYWKLGMRDLCFAREEVGSLIAAMKDGALFIQNGVTGRFIGDNKLCLAVLSDPAFDSLFETEDLALIRPHLPWSRNIGLCSPDQLQAIRSTPAEYVLKRPLDTRGNGVVIGREIEAAEVWNRSVDRAVGESWLVQQFFPTTGLETRASGQRVRRHHDLSLILTDGHLVGAMSRSSSELRTNVAQAGCLHSVFLEA